LVEFNVTQFPSERLGGARMDFAMMESFLFFIFYDPVLIDLSLVGGSFTWLISHDLALWFRIDQFLVSPDWEAWFLGVLQNRLHTFFGSFPNSS
jgi:hypothetical protein